MEVYGRLYLAFFNMYYNVFKFHPWLYQYWIPFYGYATFYLSVQQSMGIWIASFLFLFGNWIMLLWTFVFGFSFPLSVHLGVYNWNCSVIWKLYVNCLGNSQAVFQSGYIILHSHQQCMRVPTNLSTSSATFVIICLFYYGHLSRCGMPSRCVFFCISLMTSDVEYFFHVLISYLHIFFGEMSNQILYSFLSWFVFLLVVRVLFIL